MREREINIYIYKKRERERRKEEIPREREREREPELKNARRHKGKNIKFVRKLIIAKRVFWTPPSVLAISWKIVCLCAKPPNTNN